MVATHSDDDDLDDAKWDISFKLQFSPSQVASYLFLRPDVSIEKPPPVAQKVSTFAYMRKPSRVNERSYLYSSLAAYANEHLYDETGEILSAAGEVKQDRYFETLEKLATPRLSDQVKYETRLFFLGPWRSSRVLRGSLVHQLTRPRARLPRLQSDHRSRPLANMSTATGAIQRLALRQRFRIPNTQNA